MNHLQVRTAFATSEEAYMQEMRGAEGVSGTHFPERVGDFVYFVEDVPERPLVYKRRRVADPQHEEVRSEALPTRDARMSPDDPSIDCGSSCSAGGARPG